MTTDYKKNARRLRNAVEPVAAGVYFAPEAHAAYEALGFDPSPVSQDGVARPEMKAYPPAGLASPDLGRAQATICRSAGARTWPDT
ncbi:hypothetical protein [Kitasatospora sp. NPDC058218]|uniref:helix-turn-helix domain-containing protein n=1 Tax=Kitasatospora sp. NPDC058218 TaxID=3346385 RepID=UPI0036DAF06D